MKKVLAILIAMFSFLICSAQKDTTVTYDGKVVVATYTDSTVTFISVDGRQVAETENARVKSCLTSAEESCQNDRHCRDICMLNVVPPVYNPGCLLGWALSCLFGAFKP
jgi:hypothetical protein